jgi:hypothetical protein
MRSRNLLALAAATIVASCGGPEQANTVALATRAPEELQPVAAGRWRAANAQAAAMVGNLAVDETDSLRGEITLAFAHGVTVWARPAPLPREDAAVRVLVTKMRDALGAPASVFPTLYAVTDERISPSAPTGGLCGGLRTRVVAMAAFDDDKGKPVLRLAAFHTGAANPPPARPTAETLQPCFAYDFDAPESY